nr:hypothetical protein [Roseofilum sp. Guam]
MLTMIDFFFQLLQRIQPLGVPICFVSAWVFMAAIAWTLGRAMGDTLAQAKQMHQIPCAHCQFFTNDHRLKCTVNPHYANSERAIDCLDYKPYQRAQELDRIKT